MNILEDLYPNIRPKKSPVVRVVLLHLRRRVVILLLTAIRYLWGYYKKVILPLNPPA